jgi:hypothetical protein
MMGVASEHSSEYQYVAIVPLASCRRPIYSIDSLELSQSGASLADTRATLTLTLVGGWLGGCLPCVRRYFLEGAQDVTMVLSQSESPYWQNPPTALGLKVGYPPIHVFAYSHIQIFKY